MNQIARYVFFVLVPYVLCGGFWVMVGSMHGQGCFERNGWDFGDTINLVVGGLPGACIGAVIERLARKKDKEPKQKEAEEVLEDV